MFITLGSHLTVNTCIRSPRHTSYFYTMSSVSYISRIHCLGGKLKKQNRQGCRYDFCCAIPGAEGKHLVYSIHLSFLVECIAGGLWRSPGRLSRRTFAHLWLFPITEAPTSLSWISLEHVAGLVGGRQGLLLGRVGDQ